MSTSPRTIQFEAAYIRDDMAHNKEPFQRPYDFLYTGRVPAVGQRTETQLKTANGDWCILSGIVTEVGELPTFDMWITVSSRSRFIPCFVYKRFSHHRCVIPQTSSLAPPLTVCECSVDPYNMIRPDVEVGFHEHCPNPDCTMCLLRKGDNQMTLGTLMERAQEHFGTLHNHTITAYAYLNFDSYGKEDRLPVKRACIYKVVHKCNDNMMNIWCVESIQDVTDLPPSELPQVFKDWELGRESADVAPFELSDLDRKVWYLQQDLKWIRNMEEDERRVAQLAEEHKDEEDFYPEEHAHYCGPHPKKSALFLFARDSCPEIMTTPPEGYADAPELKGLLRQCITNFEALSNKERQVWDEQAAQDLQRYQREKEEFGGDY